jgi:uncharacterized protein with HEPN domain
MAASRNPLVRLGHIRDEITDLTKALKGVSFENFIGNYVLRRTAEHAILIISEAVKSLSAEFTDHYAGVDWRAVRDIGNILRHDYFEVDSKVIWRVVTDKLPELKIVIEQMIRDHS